MKKDVPQIVEYRQVIWSKILAVFSMPCRTDFDGLTYDFQRKSYKSDERGLRNIRNVLLKTSMHECIEEPLLFGRIRISTIFIFLICSNFLYQVKYQEHT